MKHVAELVSWLGGRPDCRLEPGLSEAELDTAESIFGLHMPPLWRAVLTRAYPRPAEETTRTYPDWRLGDPEGTRALVEAPVRGLLFDVEHNGFWWRAWGDRPDSVADRVGLARARLAQAPVLTPLGGHAYVGPSDDSPVFSIVQADLFIPARSLADLPGGTGQRDVPEDEWPIGSVPFWSELHAYAQLGHHRDSRFAGLASGGL